MSGTGFYGWIRDSVRRAVLLGVSDAVEQIGPPDEQGNLSPHLLAVLRHEKPVLTEAAGGSSTAVVPFAASRSRAPKKRLGKSFGGLNSTDTQ